MRNKSPAKMAASSPPVPPRISTMAFLLSSGSAGTNSNFISSSSCGNCDVQESSSSFAISLISGSFSVSSNRRDSSIPLSICLYRLAASDIFSRSRYSLVSFTNLFISPITAGSVIKVPISSNRISSPSNFSNSVVCSLIRPIFAFGQR